MSPAADLPPTDQSGEVVHRCPVAPSDATPCCGRTPFELPRTDRLTVLPEFVTCRGGRP